LINVAFTRTGTYEANTIFVVQLSDGTDYKNSMSDAPRYDSNTDTYTISASIPSAQTAGTTYSVRVTANNPSVIGTPSPTKLTTKTKPVPPTADSVQLDCQRRTSSDFYTSIFLKRSPGAVARLYDRDLNLLPDRTSPTSDPAAVNVYFQLAKPAGGADTGFVYPVSETIYYLSQINGEGCESDKVQTLSRILYRPSHAPSPANPYGPGLGKLSYCQGDSAYPLSVNGHKAPPENYRVVYTPGTPEDPTGSSTTTPPIPDTSIPGKTNYYLSLSPIDGTKGCPLSAKLDLFSYLAVEVRPLPTATLTGNQSIYEGQSAKLSVAFTGDGPWSFSYRDSTAAGSGIVQAVQTDNNPYILEVKPVKPTFYGLTSVSNGCVNVLKAKGNIIVTVVPLLGTDDLLLASAVTVYPVPATTTLTVRIQGLLPAQPARIMLLDETGKMALQQETSRETVELHLDQQPAGIYLLQVRAGDRTFSRRIVKL
jgi:hypothetical protein